jgi:hypothetical protein
VKVIHGRRAWIPDAFGAPEDTGLWGDEDDLGVRAEAVHLIVETAHPCLLPAKEPRRSKWRVGRLSADSPDGGWECVNPPKEGCEKGIL